MDNFDLFDKFKDKISGGNFPISNRKNWRQRTLDELHHNTYNDNIESHLSEERLNFLIKKYNGKVDYASSINELNQNRWNYVNRDNVHELVKKVNMEYNGEFEISGVFWTPPNGYCGWHTNSNRLGERIYLVWAEEDNKSFFRWKDLDTGKIITKWEKKGWQINRFEPPIWHCVGSYTNRISIGFRKEINSFSNGVHSATNSSRYGNWCIPEISNNNLYLKLNDIKHLLVREKLRSISFEDICWKGRKLNMDKRGSNCICCNGKRYIKGPFNYDTNHPGIIVKNVSNPLNKKYRMIDGKHRIEKMISENRVKASFFVLNLDEIKKFFKEDLND
mgnify:CR=1 FL=1